MIDVFFKHTWFAPSIPNKVDKLRVFSGQRFKKGWHKIPEELREFLPSSAVFDQKDVKKELEGDEIKSFKDADQERKDQELLEKRLAALEKGRETKRRNKMIKQINKVEGTE